MEEGNKNIFNFYEYKKLYKMNECKNLFKLWECKKGKIIDFSEFLYFFCFYDLIKLEIKKIFNFMYV